MVCWCVVLAVAGCSRTHYRLRADREASLLLSEKTGGTPWMLPFDFTVEPDPESRFYDPTPTDDPLLPVAAPRLYDYVLPELPQRDPRRFRGGALAAEDDLAYPEPSTMPSGDKLPEDDEQPDRIAGVSVTVVDSRSPTGPTPNQANSDTRSRPRIVKLHIGNGKSASAEEPGLCGSERSGQGGFPQRQDSPLEPGAVPTPTGLVRTVSYQQETATLEPEEDDRAGQRSAEDLYQDDDELRVVPIPKEDWQSLPQGCLVRMFEFASLRTEYQRTFDEEPGADQRDQSPRLALEDIVEQALINSREYQAQKELLYKAALTLSLRRFDFDLKFRAGEGATRNQADYQHNREAGVTKKQQLDVPTTIAENALLSTGGTLLTSFANKVVLKFSGPDAMAADIGSDLVLDFSQTVFQRDFAVKNLTDAERDLVYKARDYIRFRKQLFADLADRYYKSLLTYRGIEIVAQEYFSNLRGFKQGQAEFRAGRLPRSQVDQFEQSSLESRRRLIDSCNTLEGNLDDLKLQIGLPPELPINLDLTELEELTLRDEATALAERVRRARIYLLTERQQPTVKRDGLFQPAIDLVQRMLNLVEVRRRLGQEGWDTKPLTTLRNQFPVDEAEEMMRSNRLLLSEENQAAQPATELRIFWRTMDLVDSLFLLISRQLVLAEWLGAAPKTIDDIRDYLKDLKDDHEHLRTELQQTVNDRQLGRIQQLKQMAEALLGDTDVLAGRSTALLNAPQLTPDEELQLTLRQADQLIAESQQMLDEEIGGLVPVEIEMDDAMLTALTLRFDLVNQRGELADAWRDIKLTGDDLKSILNLHAKETVSTRSELSRPFGFTLDDSQAQLTMTFDAPLNRKEQRNLFRQSLIDYNAALRKLVETEDTIKKSVRSDLRQLLVDREQYSIAVASAALAYERIISTRRELRLGVHNITARDVLESQQAYTRSLNALAQAHISYILDRVKLFQDLELLEVDESGFWPMLHNEQFQPEPNYQLPNYGRPVYGELPRRAWHSHQMQRMLHVPAGNSMIFDPHSSRTAPAEEIPVPEPN